jgi:hypothetical protein
MNSLPPVLYDLRGAVGEHAAELASCVCCPLVIGRATKRKLAALRAELEYMWSGIVRREAWVDHEVVE